MATSDIQLCRAFRRAFETGDATLIERSLIDLGAVLARGEPCPHVVRALCLRAVELRDLALWRRLADATSGIEGAADGLALQAAEACWREAFKLVEPSVCGALHLDAVHAYAVSAESWESSAADREDPMGAGIALFEYAERHDGSMDNVLDWCYAQFERDYVERVRSRWERGDRSW